MIILALDTTHEEGGVGIFRDAECLASVSNQGQANQYSINLYELVEQALAAARTDLNQIYLFAAANGPGSFTGIRVGLAAALAWGKAFDRPVRGVSVLEAMASKARPQSEWAFSIIDARRGEFYLGSFRRKPSDPSAGTQPEYEAADEGWLFKPESLRAFIAERLASGVSATCVVRSSDGSAVDMAASLSPLLPCQPVEGILVDSIAEIALREMQTNSSEPASKLDAYYLRRPDAEVNWKA